jgi:hypothetical protein
MFARPTAPRAGLLLLAFSLLLSAASPALAMRVNGIGLIDYTKKSFKVGDWVRYKIDGGQQQRPRAREFPGSAHRRRRDVPRRALLLGRDLVRPRTRSARPTTSRS